MRDSAAPLRRRSSWIQDLLAEKTIKTSFGEELVTVYHPLLTLDLVPLFVFQRSSTGVIILVGLSVLLCFPSFSLLRSSCSSLGSAPFVKDQPSRVPPYIIPQADSRPLFREEHQDILMEKNRLPFCIIPSCPWTVYRSMYPRI